MDRSDRDYYRNKNRGRPAPNDIPKPRKGQESVWDYPRPPALEHIKAHGLVKYKDIIIADSKNIIKIMETASPPTYYIPENDIDINMLHKNNHYTFCEWKGEANYFDLVSGSNVIENVAWTYPDPLADTTDFLPIKHHLAFYAGTLDCYLDDEKVDPQQSKFYGGWVTSRILGPFKGEPGTSHW